MFIKKLLLILVCCASLSEMAVSEDFLESSLPDIPGLTGASLSERPDFTLLAKALSPAVVNISAEEILDGDSAGKGKPPHHSPFGSQGSGVIVSSDGLIVTNYHVIRGAERVVARLLDDKVEYVAELIGSDEMTDLALIKINPESKELAVAHFGNSDEIEVGEWVMAIGNQFQLGQTVTAGIISAKARRVGGSLSRPYDQFIQTDAPINPGSSGGPLINTAGQVIGINSAIYSPGRGSPLGGTGFNVGIGFSIPINLARSVLRQIKENGVVTRGLLGVLIQEVTTDLAEAFGLSDPYGALVSEVKDNSPAKQAGFQRRDVIIKYDGKKIRDYNELPLLVASTKVGTKVEIELIRAGKLKTLTARIGEMERPAPKLKASAEEKPDKLGLKVEELSDEKAHELDVEQNAGVIVKKVVPDSTAAKAGIRKGDLLQEIDRLAVRDGKSYERVLERLKHGKTYAVLVRRSDGAVYVTIKP
ncbi:MAG: Do family serine endopeptidase [Bdellovibrionales bacterium]|nr:Do family serine endopeptidase [Bdellovibrionales bacterium]